MADAPSSFDSWLRLGTAKGSNELDHSQPVIRCVPTRRREVLASIVAALVGATSVERHTFANPSEPPRAEPPMLSSWSQDVVTLKNGRVIRGLIQEERADELDLIEFVQSPGKPLRFIALGLVRGDIATIERLSADARRETQGRFHRFRCRVEIESRQSESLALKPVKRAGDTIYVYDGPWFAFEAMSDDAATRLCVVRTEQVFRAFRTLIPPRVEQPRRPQLELHGSVTSLRERYAQLGVRSEAAAIYMPTQQLIVVGGELVPFGQRLAEARRAAADVLAEYEQLERELPKQLAHLSTELQKAGTAADDIRNELVLRRTRFQKEKTDAVRRLQEMERRNTAKFDEFTREMLARLRHEAFHAYFDTAVFPHDRHAVPRWLHEGLAQLVEFGQLENDVLRLDAPDPTRLKALRQDLLGATPLSLETLFTSDGTAFTGDHALTAQRHYLYAWGVAYHLVFREALLANPRLESFVSPTANESRDASTVLRRFENLTGKPIASWQRVWREAIRADK